MEETGTSEPRQEQERVIGRPSLLLARSKTPHFSCSRGIVRYEKDETGSWVATVKEVRGCHTQGRTIDQARRRIKEALELFVDHADEAELIDDVVLPANVELY